MGTRLNRTYRSEMQNKYWEIIREYNCMTLDCKEEHVEYFTGSYSKMLKRCCELDSDLGPCAAYIIDPITKERL